MDVRCSFTVTNSLALRTLIVSFCLMMAAPVSAVSSNGFDLSKTDVPLDEIHEGGPPRDGIPAISNPRFESVAGALWLAPSDRVLAIVIDSDARAYPIRILNWHEIVNDVVGDRPVVISFCPLCGTGMAFDRHAGVKPLTFGVSGLLYNSDVLMYDRETESLWSQIMMKAVSGRMRGKSLRLLPLEHTTWMDFKTRHPNGKVLSRETGHMRDYGRSPYSDYAFSPQLYFPVSHHDDRLFTKTEVAGVVLNGVAKAYPLHRLKAEPPEFQDTLGDTRIVIRYDRASDAVRMFDLRGKEIPVVRAFWFAWAAFHPHTEIFSTGK